MDPGIFFDFKLNMPAIFSKPISNLYCWKEKIREQTFVLFVGPLKCSCRLVQYFMYTWISVLCSYLVDIHKTKSLAFLTNNLFST